ncbi:MAG: hypothetical protein PUP91_02895 [Rhizonema sp. PD37]|nr:hypothetical protein [Rhizonema sp. PD37]
MYAFRYTFLVASTHAESTRQYDRLDSACPSNELEAIAKHWKMLDNQYIPVENQPAKRVIAHSFARVMVSIYAFQITPVRHKYCKAFHGNDGYSYAT